jgi:hypothetical protein
MAREFSGVGQYLTANVIPTSLPVTLACLFYAHSTGRSDFLITIGMNGGVPASKDFLGLRANGGAGGDPIQAVSWSGSTALANSTAGFSANTWHHGCAVFAAANDRRAYIDGGNKGTNATNKGTTMNRLTIAALRRESLVSDLHDGAIAETGVWDVALNDVEIALLPYLSPLLIRPESLVWYVPFIRDDDNNLAGPNNFTTVGAPTIFPHPRIIYPGVKQQGISGAVAPPPYSLRVQVI